MGFLIYCNNKGCGKSQEPLLDKISNDVYCTECGEVIDNVTVFTKNAMRGMGQIKRDDGKAKLAFAIKCDTCGHKEQPKLANNQLACKKCDHLYENLSPPYIHAVKQWLKSNTAK